MKLKLTSNMTPKLTKKQRGFVKDYLATGNGTQAALANYETNNIDVAKSIASENLTKPYIQQAVSKVIDKDLLTEKHLELLEQTRIDYFVFPKWMEDDEIVIHVEDATGIKVLNVRETEKGKMAFYAIADAQARGKALDLAYKLRGDYAPEKSVSVNVQVEADTVVRELTNKLNAIHGSTSVPSDGEPASVMGTETQD